MSVTNVADFVELSHHLKQERLYIASEREQLQSLHVSVGAGAERLFHSAWIARQQKDALSQLILASEDATPAACCQRVNTLELVTVADGYRRLTYHESKIGRFLYLMRDNAKAVATCLLATETSDGVEQMHRVASAVVSGLYGNVLLSEDEHCLLLLLKHLIDVQVDNLFILTSYTHRQLKSEVWLTEAQLTLTVDVHQRSSIIIGINCHE